MSNIDKIAKELAKAIPRESKTSPYDTQAVVKRVDGDTAWVHIPGGVDETPVQLTTNAKKGDVVQVRISGGKAWITGNATAPPTDDTKAIKAESKAEGAKVMAVTAQETAIEAYSYADQAKASAEDAANAASDAWTKAGEAETAAGIAQNSADKALLNLSTIENVVDTLNWITEHGTMQLTSDTSINPSHVYFVVDPNGDYVVGGTHYSLVTDPKDSELNTYYELSIDESINNYVATHLAVDSEGLWIIPEIGGNKILIAVGGSGHTYSIAGTYIIDSNNNVVSKFTSNGVDLYKNGVHNASFGTDIKIGNISDNLYTQIETVIDPEYVSNELTAVSSTGRMGYLNFQQDLTYSEPVTNIDLSTSGSTEYTRITLQEHSDVREGYISLQALSSSHSHGGSDLTLSESGISYSGRNNILWEATSSDPAKYMTDSQTVYLSGSIIAQLSGVVLVWSRYGNNTVYNDSWCYQYIPKWHVDVHDGGGIYFSTPTGNNTNTVCIKYLYVSNTYITGHANNSSTGTGYANNTRVLRAVLGV